MKKKLLVVWAVPVGLLVLASPLLPHHAGGMYDREHLVTVSGRVTDYAFRNPHVQIRFDVTDQDGGVQSWVAESGAPQRLYRAGWDRNTLKLGDQITVTGAPAKDGRKMMSIHKLTGPGGKVLNQGAG